MDPARPMTVPEDRCFVALARLVGAYDACDGNRGAFSTCEPHDLRCPKSRAASPAEWRGVWECVCGRERLDLALIEARAALAAAVL